MLQLINTIVAEYGTADLELLQEKLDRMRILENVELPGTIMELLLETQESIVDTAEEEESKDESKDESAETSAVDENEEETEAEKVEDPGTKIKVKFEPDQKRPKMVRMANLCVVSGHTVNGVAEIHSEIVKKEVFNEFYEVIDLYSLAVFLPSISCDYRNDFIVLSVKVVEGTSTSLKTPWLLAAVAREISK